MRAAEIQAQARAAVLPCTNALLKDANTRWGDGGGVAIYREGPRRQPQGFKSDQVFATIVDPRLKDTLIGIQSEEYETVWKLLEHTVTRVALEKVVNGPATPAVFDLAGRGGATPAASGNRGGQAKISSASGG